MNNKYLADFAAKARGIERRDKLKLILFAAGLKPATYIALKINGKNLGEKNHLQKHLEFYKTSRPKGFEQITKIRKNKVYWEFKGIWYGFDIFSNKKVQEKFEKYVKLIKQHKHTSADKLAGEIYRYPACCIKQYLKEQNKTYLRNKYSYYSYYTRLHDSERKFPFVLHTPCSLKCKATAKINKENEKAVKKLTPKFYREYVLDTVHRTAFLVDAESTLKLKPTGKAVWSMKERDGHEYSLIGLNKVNSHYFLYSYLTKTRLPRGTVFEGYAIRQYFYADIALRSYKTVYKTVNHMRKFRKP